MKTLINLSAIIVACLTVSLHAVKITFKNEQAYPIKIEASNKKFSCELEKGESATVAVDINKNSYNTYCFNTLFNQYFSLGTVSDAGTYTFFQDKENINHKAPVRIYHKDPSNFIVRCDSPSLSSMKEKEIQHWIEGVEQPIIDRKSSPASRLSWESYYENTLKNDTKKEISKHVRSASLPEMELD